MALSLYAANEGYLDSVEVEKIGDFEEALHDFARSNNAEFLQQINDTGNYSDEEQAGLKAICEGFAEKGAY
jgi:F-type H+-transporting ATPase subunit alpha